jgi:CRP/FNR family cyclic AMP-dependent transcriptional regulator
MMDGRRSSAAPSAPGSRRSAGEADHPYGPDAMLTNPVPILGQNILDAGGGKMEELEQILRQHPFLEGMERRHLRVLVECAFDVCFDAGKFLFREGETADRVYFIRQGTVAIEIFSPQRGPIKIESLTNGGVLGWSWLVAPYYWRFDARAVDTIRAIALDGKWLRNKCETDRDLGYELLKRFVSIVDRRLQATRLQLVGRYGE